MNKTLFGTWLFSILFANFAFSQEEQFQDFVDMNQKMANQEIDQTIKNPSLPIPGEMIRSLVETVPTFSQGSCFPTSPELSKEKKGDQHKIEVLIIFDQTTANQGFIHDGNDIDEWRKNTYQGDVSENVALLKKATTPVFVQDPAFGEGNTSTPVVQVNNPIKAPTSLDASLLRKWVIETNKLGNTFSNEDKLDHSKYVEAIVQTIPLMQDISEKELSKQIASAIGGVAKTDEEKYQMLSILSERLYHNYNRARNPGYNNSTNNPNGEALPSGSLSLSSIFTAAANQEMSKGGVCNDISEAVAKIGEELFPEKDVLVINAGTHFAVLVVDKNGSKVIDGSYQNNMDQQLTLGPNLISNNVRINKVIDGHLKEIAVMDTQLGDLVKSTTGSPVPTLKSGANFNKIIAQTKITLSENEKKRRALTIAGGAGELLESKVTVIAAKLSSEGQGNNSYVTVGADKQQWKTSELAQWGNEYHIILNAGFDRTLIRYVNPKVKLTYTSGVHMGASLGLGVEGVDIYGTSGNLDLLNRVNLENNPANEKAVSLKGQVMVDNTFGPRNWGETTGATSSVTGGGVLKALSQMTFHLNQINVNGSATKQINNRLKLQTAANYTGSNVGQSVGVITGLQVESKRGASLFYFVGAETSKLKGYQTKNSLLVGSHGAKTGVTLVGKNGKLEGSASVSNIAPNQKPQINATAKILLNSKKKKVKKVD